MWFSAADQRLTTNRWDRQRLLNQAIEEQSPAGANEGQRGRALQRWYRRELKELVAPLIQKWECLLSVKAAAWGIKRMKTRWGTCNADARRIWLNLELVKKPVQCVEYVIVHELAHLHERRHNEHFIALLNEHLPRWSVYRRELNSTPLAHESWRY